MTLTDDQKQALRARAASAKVQSKLKDSHAGEIGWYDENDVWHDGLKPLDEDVSHETFDDGEGAYARLEETQTKAFLHAGGIRSSKDAGEHVPVGPIEYPPPVPEEESGGLEQAYYSRADEERDLATADYYDQKAREQSKSGNVEQMSVDDIPWNGGQPFQDAEVGTITSLVPLNEQAIVEGFTIPPGMDEDQVLDLSSRIYTYIGPIPVHIGRYTNKWFKVLGCCVQPLEGDVVNERTGEVEHIKWERPLFKLDKVDPDTGENIIAYGGGIRGLQIARHFNAISGQFGWTVGDFKRPRMFYVQQENRENAHVMYGFRHRACTEEELGK